MPFSSLTFLLCFLPGAALAWHTLGRYRRGHTAVAVPLLASLIYYALWKPEHLWILLVSVTLNYAFGQGLARAAQGRKTLLWSGLTCNLAALAYFKYAGFAITIANSLSGTSLSIPDITLPLGISFFTFQQIAYLVDVYNGTYDARAETFWEYCLIVCFFPYVVSGPIIRHPDIAPQIKAAPVTDWENIFNGLVLLSIGLAKKVLIADNLAPIVHYSFDLSGKLTFLEACFSSLTYTLQLYFDFSGYCDMAMGCALFFNIKLPWNFLSPYQAANIQDFWRRWHITLSLWLRDYLYIPLGGSRKGTRRTLINIFATFLLGGLWHGAAWTFVLWGAMHGVALALHRLWTRIWKKRMSALCGWLLTFCFLNLTWTVFRAPNFKRLGKFADALLGYNGFGFRHSWQESLIGAAQLPSFTAICLFVGTSLWLTLFSPNAADLLQKDARYRLWLAVTLSTVALLLAIPESHPEFIYSQF